MGFENSNSTVSRSLVDKVGVKAWLFEQIVLLLVSVKRMKICGARADHLPRKDPESKDRCWPYPDFSSQHYLSAGVYDGYSFVKREDSAFQQEKHFLSEKTGFRKMIGGTYL